MTTTSSVKDLGLSFLRAFWDADPESGFALCGPDSVWLFQRSLHEPQRVAVRDAVDWLNRNLVSQFDPDSGYEIEVLSAIAEGHEAAIEYTATGKTRSGEIYSNRYHVRFTEKDGFLVSIRPFFDTHYVHRVLFSLD